MRIYRTSTQSMGLGLAALALAFSCQFSESWAATCAAPGNSNLFNATVCVDGEVASEGMNSIQDLIDLFDNSTLESLFASYEEDTSAAEFQLDVRGLPAIVSYDQNSSVLHFVVPSLGINETFDGGTRDASNDLFEDYLKQHGSDILRELLKVSPVDPLAGNPSSLQSSMIADAFSAGFGGDYDSLEQGSSFSMGARFGNYGLGQFDQHVWTLPISYTYTFANYDRLIIQSPLTYMDINGAKSYRYNLGVSFKKNLLPRWAITPGIGYGVSGSTDLGSLGHVASLSLTSDLMLFHSDELQISLGNMIGYYMTLPIRISDYDVDYDLRNTILRNGLLVSMPWKSGFWGLEWSVDAYLIDTRFFGDDLYSDNYQEFGLSLGPRRPANKLQPNVSSHPIGIGLKYITGDGDVDGFELTFGYRF